MPDASASKAVLKKQVDDFFSAVDRAVDKLKPLGEIVNSQELKNKAEEISAQWHDELYPALENYGAKPEQLSQFEAAFVSLKDLATTKKPAHRKKKYLAAFNAVQGIHQDILKFVFYSRETEQPNYLSKIIADLELEEAGSIELSFLKEASGCAPMSIRASLIMAWSATVARIHRVIEEQGFDKFNQASQTAAQKKGRFTRLGGKSHKVASRKDLTEISDGDLILIVEAMDLYSLADSKLMDYCLSVRNDSAHPTAFNATPRILELFARGIEQAVFSNAKMKITITP